jgi:hypothetical protein
MAPVAAQSVFDQLRRRSSRTSAPLRTRLVRGQAGQSPGQPSGKFVRRSVPIAIVVATGPLDRLGSDDEVLPDFRAGSDPPVTSFMGARSSLPIHTPTTKSSLKPTNQASPIVLTGPGLRRHKPVVIVGSPCRPVLSRTLQQADQLRDDHEAPVSTHSACPATATHGLRRQPWQCPMVRASGAPLAPMRRYR